MTHERTRRAAAVHLIGRGRPLFRALDTTDPRAWLALDEDARRAQRWGTPDGHADHSWLTGGRAPGWRALLGRALPGPVRPPSEARLALALCAPEGRIREAALPHAEGRPALLPLVAVRAADWAEPVRHRALEQLRTALPAADPDTLARTAPVLLRLAARARGADAVAVLHELLLTGPAPVVTRLLLSCRDAATRRAALAAVLDRGLCDGPGLALVAAGDTDPAVQERASSAAIAADDPAAVIPVLLGARFARARAAGVTALRRAGRHGEAEPYLYDRSGRVRACARWVLREGGADPVALYRAACADPSGPPDRAPLGLGECGARAVDAPLLWRLTGHPRDGVRTWAVAGLRQLGSPDRARLAALLDDPAPGVVREARRALRG